MTELTDVHDLPGLPYAAADAWLRSALPDLVGDEPWSAEVISGGLSNITYALHTAGGELVLRRGPLARALPSAHDMLREARVLGALAGTAVPVPVVHAVCDDESVLGGPFYVMDRSPGAVLRTAEDTAALTVSERAAVSEELVTVLAALHGVAIPPSLMSGFGRPEGYLQRQVRRWGQQWEASRTVGVPDMDRLLRLLGEQLPERESGHAVVHGDYRLDNTLVSFAQKAVLGQTTAGGDPLGSPAVQITAVLDWELSTLGDPLADLAVTMTYWHDPGDEERALIPVAVGVTAHDGFPTAAGFAAAYAGKTGADLTELPFYLALAAMKLGVILQGINFRHAGGQTVGEGYQDLSTAVPVLAARGLRALAAGEKR